MIQPHGVIMCRPTHFEVIDRKNPFMDPANAVDRRAADKQWEAVASAFRACGVPVHEVDAQAGCEDMVFTANPAFAGIAADGSRRAVASRMRFPSRRAEVVPLVQRLRQLGYDIVEIPEDVSFEGGGDAVWHSDGSALFLGIGPRTGMAAAPLLERAFEVEVIPLTLKSERFYHLDTALSVIGETAIVHAGAFDADSYTQISNRFSRIIEVDDAEADRMACNAAWAGGRNVIIDAGATVSISRLKDAGYDVLPVDTSEFMKSGGSVYCMKQYVF